MSNHPTAKSWFDRASETVKGVLLGVALFCSSFLLLFFNEGSAVQALQGLNGGAGSALSISTDRINPAHEGALVHFSGTATPDMPLTDDTFGITTTALRLDRTVEMFQWQERESGYVKGWSTSVVDSSAFKVRKNHRNPTTLPLASTSVAANRVTVGAFTLPASLTERITQTEVLPVDGLKLRKNVRAYGSSLYLGADPINPQIGDVRVQFSVVKPAVVSVVARQAGATLEPYPTQSGAMVEVLLPGTVAAPAMFQAAQDANVLATWFLRLLGFLMIGLTSVTNLIEVPEDYVLATCVGAVLVGFMLPEIYIKNVAAKRREILNSILPEGLDLLTICVEAGLSIDAAFRRVSREMQGSMPELAVEFEMTAIELTYLPDRQQALENMADRSDSPAVAALVNALRQTEKYGTPLAASLRILSQEFRQTRASKAEEKGARMPALMTVPLMVFILPTLITVLIAPAIMSMFAVK